MTLELKRPLVVFDLETTGININNDRIVEVCFIKIQPDGTEETMIQRINPTIPIPKAVTKIHGISDEDVKDEPTFKDLSQKFNEFLKNCDFGGFNSNKFDFPLLVEEFYRAGIDFDTDDRKFIDVQRIFHTMEPRNLSAAYKFYCEKSLENAHSAKADTEATWEILKAQLERYETLEKNIEFLHKFSGQSNFADLAGRMVYNEHGDVLFNFGKHKGKKVKDVLKQEPGYYDWIQNNDFAFQTKKVLTRIRLESFGEKK